MEKNIPHTCNLCNHQLSGEYINDYMVILNCRQGVPEIDHLIKKEYIQNYHMVNGNLCYLEEGENKQGELNIMTIQDYVRDYPIRNGKCNYIICQIKYED